MAEAQQQIEHKQVRTFLEGLGERVTDVQLLRNGAPYLYYEPIAKDRGPIQLIIPTNYPLRDQSASSALNAARYHPSLLYTGDISLEFVGLAESWSITRQGVRAADVYAVSHDIEPIREGIVRIMDSFRDGALSNLTV